MQRSGAGATRDEEDTTWEDVQHHVSGTWKNTLDKLMNAELSRSRHGGSETGASHSVHSHDAHAGRADPELFQHGNKGDLSDLLGTSSSAHADTREDPQQQTLSSTVESHLDTPQKSGPKPARLETNIQSLLEYANMTTSSTPQNSRAQDSQDQDSRDQDPRNPSPLGWWGQQAAQTSITASTDGLNSFGLSMTTDSCRFVATGGADGLVKVWDVVEMTFANVLDGHSERVTGLVWAKAARKGCALLLASASLDGTVIIWALQTDGTLLERRVLAAHTGRVVGMEFLPGGRKLVTSSVDSSTYIWRVDSGKIDACLNGHSSGLTSMASLTIKSAMALATCDASGTWCLWDLALKQCVLSGREKGGCNQCHFTPPISSLSPPRPLLVTCQWRQSRHESSIYLWDVFDPRQGRQTTIPAVHCFRGISTTLINDVSFTIDNSSRPLMAAASASGALTILDLSARTILMQLRDVHVGPDGAVMAINSVHYSLDGRMLFTSGADCSVKVWSTADMEVLLTLLGHNHPVACLANAGDPRIIASGSTGGELAFWDLKFAEELADSSQPSFMQ